MRLFAKRKLPPTRTPLSTVVGFATFLPLKAQGSASREYLNVPVDTIQFFGDIVGINGETAAASDLPFPNKVIITRNGFLSFLWSFPLSGKYGGLVVNAGHAAVKVNGPLGTAKTSGFTDPSVAFHANLFGAPALRLEQFPTATPQTFASLHLTVNAHSVRMIAIPL